MKTMTGAILAGMVLAAWGTDEDGRQAALRKLDTVKISVDFRETPLAQAIDYLREATGLNLVFTPRAAEKDPEAKVTLKVRDVGLRAVLRLLLRPRDLGVTWRDGAFQVVTREDLGSAVVLRMYDIRSHLLKVRDFAGPAMELTSPDGARPQVCGIIVIESDTLKDSPIGEELLLDLIRANTGRRSWDENPSATISAAGGILVVNQTPAVHCEVEQLLAKLIQYR
jgi:hypothetical protein